MTSVTTVPETTSMTGEELSANHAWATIRNCRRSFYAEAFARFRYGDGFSHSRALGLQLSLAFVPLVIALFGLSNALHAEQVGEVIRLTLLSLTPGRSDGVIMAMLGPPEGDGDGHQAALWLGLVAAVVALTSAMAQVERGANRIYGIRRDRPSVRKYARALVMGVAAGIPAVVSFVVLVAGPSFGEAVEQVYGIDDDEISLAALPLGVVLLLVSITAMLRRSPRRRQPGWSWLALGAAASMVLSLAFTGLLAAYLAVSGSFGAIYGPLTGVMALLLWSQLIAVAIFLGLALAAQLEAVRAGVRSGAVDDPAEVRVSASGARAVSAATTGRRSA